MIHDLEKELEAANGVIAEQNKELVRLYKQAQHWEKKCDEIAVSRYNHSKESKERGEEIDNLLRVMSYLTDRLIEAYGYDPKPTEDE